MTYEEKGTWVFLVVSVAAFVGYLAWLVGQLLGTPPAEIAYAHPMLWAIGGAAVASILGRLLIVVAAPREAGKSDQRDREIQRFGDHGSRFFVDVAGIAALVMALLELDHFWITNTLYFGFVGTALVALVVMIVSYRRGFYPG
ncbi:MAG: hypothetical protein C4333_01410 [Meiothermus sp.]